MKRSSPWEILFYAFHQSNPVTFSMIDAVNKNPANVYAFFCFIREYYGSPYQIIFYHCLKQMPLPGHLSMPFYRIKFRGALTFFPADITICFKSSDRHSYDFFYLFCLCFDNIHPTSPDCLTNADSAISPQIKILIARLFLTRLQRSCECSPNRRIFDSFRSEKHSPCSMVCQTPGPSVPADVRKS